IHLKNINDEFGYAVGDEVLRTVGDALRDFTRSTDVVARYGGDEFAALLVDARGEDGEGVLGRVQQKLSDPAAKRALSFSVSCNIGYSVSQNPPESVDELLRAADIDMQTKRIFKVRKPTSSGASSYS